MTIVEITALKRAIETIFAERTQKASQSEYDRSVLLGAVAAARDAVENVAWTDAADAYKEDLLETLSELRASYNDPDGQYTNGKAMIGDIYTDFYALFESL